MSRKVNRLYERFFYWWGCAVASNPYKVILATLLLTGLCSLGLLNFTSEADGWKIWLPEGSRHSEVLKWKEAHFVEDTRGTITLFSHEDNVLTVEALLLLLDLHQRVQAVEFQGKNYTHACMKIPITNIGLANKGGRRKRRQAGDSEEIEEESDYSHYEDYFNFYGTGDNEDEVDEVADGDDKLDDLPKDIYCDIVETLKDKCGEFSLLEIWNYDEEIISKLSEQDILDAINSLDESPVFGYSTNYTDYLGQVEYDSSGHVVKAKSIRSIWEAIQ